MNVVGYLRVSTDEQGESGAGLEAQRAKIESECARRGWAILRFEQDILSGRSLRRPGVQAALAACESGEADGIVVSALDRLSRSMLDFAGVIERARLGGWNVVALDLGVDLSTPAGEFMANVMAAMAQWERRIISQRTKDALTALRARGVRLGRPSSTSPEVAGRVRRLRGEGMTYRAICADLEAHSVPTSRGGKRWRPSALSAILKEAA